MYVIHYTKNSVSSEWWPVEKNRCKHSRGFLDQLRGGFSFFFFFFLIWKLSRVFDIASQTIYNSSSNSKPESTAFPNLLNAVLISFVSCA